MTPTDRDAGHCGGKDCFQDRPEADPCLCDCEGCIQAVAAEIVEQAREEAQTGRLEDSMTTKEPLRCARGCGREITVHDAPRAVDLGYAYQCAECALSHWSGGPAPVDGCSCKTCKAAAAPQE